MKAAEVYEAMTARFIADIEAGIANPDGWRKPWANLEGQRNATTSKAYQGFNQLLLSYVAMEREYSAPVWATFKQWQAIGAQVRKGEKGTHLIKWVSKTCDHPRNVICNRCGSGFPVAFCVFNAGQVDGFTYTAPVRSEFQPLEAAEVVITAARGDGVTIRHLAQGRAYYERNFDMITLPPMESFHSQSDYYSTTLHELSHASGHENRCDRARLAQRFGDDHYAMEELVAEMGSAFMCATLGIPDSEVARHGDYLANWARVLRADSKALAHAASQAQKAANYWLDLAGAGEAESAEEVAA